MGNDGCIPLRGLAWACCLIPLLAVHGSYAISAGQGLVPICLPYLEGCTSISRAARSGDAIHLFRPLMLGHVALLLAFWWGCRLWLHRLRASPRVASSIQLSGSISALFLALYVTYLGENGEQARWLRRYGINLYFSLSVLAQMLLTWQLQRHRSATSTRWQRLLIGLCGGMLLLGLASLPLQFLVADRGALLNSIEWSFALMMVSVFGVVGQLWSADRLQLQFLARPGR